jgi:hypothetical protein
LNFAHTFCHIYKIHEYGLFILQCVSLMCLKLWDIGWIMFKKLKIHWMSFLNSQKNSYFKFPFKHLKIIIWKKYFVILFIRLTASWFEIGKGKNATFNIIQIFISKASFQLHSKKILIRWNCDTLVCFNLVMKHH